MCLSSKISIYEIYIKFEVGFHLFIFDFELSSKVVVVLFEISRVQFCILIISDFAFTV